MQYKCHRCLLLNSHAHFFLVVLIICPHMPQFVLCTPHVSRVAHYHQTSRCALCLADTNVNRLSFVRHGSYNSLYASAEYTRSPYCQRCSAVQWEGDTAFQLRPLR